MTELSRPTDGKSRLKVSVIEARLRTEKGTAVSDQMKKSDSWVRKVLDRSQGILIDDIESLLKALDLKVVDKNKVCVDKAEHESFMVLAGKYMQTKSKQLDWGDDGDDNQPNQKNSE
jgi:hypothetical protein